MTELDLDVTALARLVENVKVDAPLAYANLSRWMVARRELILADLERAELAEGANLDALILQWLRDWSLAGPLTDAAHDLGDRVRAALAPAPAEEGSELVLEPVDPAEVERLKAVWARRHTGEPDFDYREPEDPSDGR